MLCATLLKPEGSFYSGRAVPPPPLPRGEASERGQREPSRNQVSEATGHLSPSLEARDPRGQHRVAPPPGGSMAELRPERRAAAGSSYSGTGSSFPALMRGKDVEEMPLRRLSCPVLSFPFSFCPFLRFSLFFLPPSLPFSCPSSLPLSSLSYPLPFSRPSLTPSRPRGAAPRCARLAVSPLDLVLLIRF